MVKSSTPFNAITAAKTNEPARRRCPISTLRAVAGVAAALRVSMRSLRLALVRFRHSVCQARPNRATKNEAIASRPGRSVCRAHTEQSPCPGETMAVIRLPEIEEIFTVLERLAISREAVVIPLTKRDPGSVRLLPDERLEIVAPESRSVREWLTDLENQIRALLEGKAGD
jgi:hypothetical protein